MPSLDPITAPRPVSFSIASESAFAQRGTASTLPMTKALQASDASEGPSPTRYGVEKGWLAEDQYVRFSRQVCAPMLAHIPSTRRD